MHLDHDSASEAQHQQADPRFWRHAQFPSHTDPLEETDGSATGVGSCGDIITIRIVVREDRIQAIEQHPDGCVYTVACGSAVSVLAQGKTIEQALELQPEDVVKELGGLPEDHLHCARLAVNTLGEAIADLYHTKQH